MKVLLLNGSPRENGNTKAAVKLMQEGAKGCDTEIIDVASHKLSCCMACDACKTNGGNCITKDESAWIVEKMVEADMIVFATPVYWWGISAQLKMAIDKLYSKSGKMGNLGKKIAIVSIGGAEIGDRQYELIKGQFECIADYLKWQLVFSESFSAYDAGEILDNSQAVEKLKSLLADI